MEGLDDLMAITAELMDTQEDPGFDQMRSWARPELKWLNSTCIASKSLLKAVVLCSSKCLFPRSPKELMFGRDNQDDVFWNVSTAIPQLARVSAISNRSISTDAK